ncbi:hypothetical protein [Herpetosiphon geysericola]|uniref:Uncharacterized protein n=1 Tax=Herpetosiphon geysericola TaxID=70996 RepID=A0A0P6XT35_9CHLR|nr:hypothetical protein [Herpetosiphon geysericola]KPL87542.1 hypothetical protein SE18_10775 [Herpetosiphon geysericola]
MRLFHARMLPVWLIGMLVSFVGFHQPSAASLTSSQTILGSWDTTLGRQFARPGTLTTLTLDAQGHLYVLGDFAYTNNVETNGLARWNGTEWEQFGLTPADRGRISELTPYHDGFVVGGNFSRLQNQPRNHVARWDGTSFQGLGSGLTDRLDYAAGDVQVHSFAVFSDTLMIGGNFRHFNQGLSTGIAHWDGAAQPQGQLFNKPVFSLARTDQDVIAAGSFTTVSGQSARYLALWANQQWQPIVNNFTTHYLNLYEVNQTIYLVAQERNVVTSRLYRWDGSGFVAESTAVSGILHDVTSWNNQIYAVHNNQLVRLNGGVWQSVTLPMTTTAVTALVGNATTLYIGGRFSLNGVASDLVAWDGTTLQSLAVFTTPDSMTQLAGDAGYPVVLQEQYAFDQSFLKRWNGTSWQTLAHGRYELLGGLMFHTLNQQLYLFLPQTQTLAPGEASSAVWRLDGASLESAEIPTSQHLTWYPSGPRIFTVQPMSQPTIPMTGIIEFDAIRFNQIAAEARISSDEMLFVAGSTIFKVFIHLDQFEDYLDLTRWDGQEWEYLGSRSIPKGYHRGTVWNNQLYLLLGHTLYRVSDTGVFSQVGIFDGPINAVAGVAGGGLYIAGDFSQVNSTHTGPIVRYNGSTFDGLSQQPNGAVTHLSADHEQLYVGGSFTHVGSTPSLGVAVFRFAQAEPTATPSLSPTPSPSLTPTVSVNPLPKWVYLPAITR